jgi:hypothetical protein
MHVLILSKRNAQAQTRLLRAAEALAEHFDLDPDLLASLKPKDKDINVRGLKQREAAAALVEALAIKVGALEEPAPQEEEGVTAVTDERETETAYEPTDEDLPPPVLEGEGIQGAPITDDEGVQPHTGDEFVTTPPEPGEEEQTADLPEEFIEDEPEEAPARKPKKQSSRKSSKKK